MAEYEQLDDNTLVKIDMSSKTITKAEIENKITQLNNQKSEIIPKTEPDEETLNYWNATFGDEMMLDSLNEQLDYWNTLLSIFEE